MGSVWKLFNPLWRLIAAHEWVTVAVLTLGTVATLVIHQNTLGVTLGMCLGGLMCWMSEQRMPDLALPEA
ncbi:hypothetical protein [Roseomonas sp. BN140053]|uniref:hypothetical protein n=1 Tax=Roseomonas sp. BN140053 TaxID=3391898 RepID=UPI0039ED2B48